MGHYDATDAPVLSIRSSDTVVIQTLLTNSPAGLEKAGVAPKDVEPELRAVYDGVPTSRRDPAGPILTGPLAIEGAEPGDTLEVRILKIDLAIPYGYNAFRYGARFLTDDFPHARMKIVPLDRTRMIGRFAPGIEVPLHPFFGSMAVAPPPVRPLRFGAADDQPRQHGRQGAGRGHRPVPAGHAHGALFRRATAMRRRATARSTSPHSKHR